MQKIDHTDDDDIVL